MITRGQSGPGSSPCSRPPRSLWQTSPVHQRMHRLQPEHAAPNLNRRSDRRGCWSISVFQSCGHHGKKIALRQSRHNIIGRDADKCNIVLGDDIKISREHCKVQYEHGEFVIYDLASLSGTFVDDKLVRRQTLIDGDIIRIGRTEFLFKRTWITSVIRVLSISRMVVRSSAGTLSGNSFY